MGAGLEWVEHPETPGIGRESQSSSPTLSSAGADPTPTSHTHLGPVRPWEGLLHCGGKVR